ncbi:hypothetical protein D3C81_1453510 [compost metagenome]
MCPDNAQEFDNLLAFFDIENEALLAFNTACIQVKLVGQIHQCLTVFLIHGGNLQVVGRTFGIVHRPSSHKGPSKVSPLTTVFPGQIRINPRRENEPFGYDLKLIQNLLYMCGNPHDVYVILLQTHLLTHEQLRMDVEILFDQRINPSCYRGVFGGNIQNNFFVRHRDGTVHPD